MATNDDIHADLYRRINTLESKVDVTNGYLRGIVESNEKLIAQNDKLIKQNTRNNYLYFVLALVGWLVVAYGAVGRDGLLSVRKTLPAIPVRTEAIPAHNDFDVLSQPHKPKTK